MGQINISATAAVPLSVAFAYVDDYRYVPDWMFGMSKFDPLTEQVSGLGAEYETVVNIGPKALRSKVRVTDWAEDAVIELTSYEGMVNSSRWEFRAVDEEHTKLTVDFRYEFGGGLAGKALAKVIEPLVGEAMRQTEKDLRTKAEEHYRSRE